MAHVDPLQRIAEMLTALEARMSAMESREAARTAMPDDADRREEFSAPVHPTTDDPDETPLPRMISDSKEKLTAIPELSKPEDWPRFSSQLALILDAKYPFVSEWVQRITRLSDRPTAITLKSIARDLHIEDFRLYEQFTLDLWVVLTIKVQGQARSILALIHTELRSTTQRNVRGPAAFHELHCEHHGRLVDQQVLLNRKVNHPERAKTVADMGEHLRKWEAHLAEWELLNDTHMSDIQKAGTMMSLMPLNFENQVAMQHGLDLDPRALRVYMLCQAARARTKTTDKTVGPSPGGGQAVSAVDFVIDEPNDEQE